MELEELIKQYKLISFDIFDTLVKRNVKCPVDVFLIVENIYNNRNNIHISNFQNNRINAEKKARVICDYEEVTLEEIYKQLENIYSCEVAKKLMDIEIRVELSLCQGKKDIIRYFDYAKKLGKTVVITSDMYLPKVVVEKILDDNEIKGYDYLYLSSVIKKTKYTGNLFRYIKEQNNIEYKDILHIGDNVVSDIKKANQFGIKTYHIAECKTGRLSNRIYNKLRLKLKNGDFYKNILEIFIKNNIDNDIEEIENPNLYRFGYEFLGPVLYGFLNNIEKRAIEMNLEHIYFFSRDGYLLKEAYDKYYKSNYSLSYSYLYVSRKAVVTPMLEKDYSIEQIKDVLGVKGWASIKSFLKRLSNNVDKYKEYFENNNLSLNDIINFNGDIKELEDVYLKIKDELFVEINQQRNLLNKYLIQEGFNKYNKVGIMDLGWRGSLQYSIEKVIDNNSYDIDLYGFYLGLTEEYNYYRENGMKAEAYIFMPKDADMKNRVIGAKGLVELLFSAPHGSTLGYSIINNNVRPIFDEMDYGSEQQKKINDLQIGALNFVKDFSSRFYEINISKDVAIDKFIRYISNPKLKEVNLFEKFEFNDFGKNNLVNAQNLKYYIRKPKQLIYDFGESRWKIGFMKRLFKIKINYFKCYCLLKKL